MEADPSRYAFRPSIARRKAVADGIFLGFGLLAAYQVASALPGFRAMFAPERLSDIPLSVLLPAILTVLAIGLFLRMFAVALLEGVKLLRSGRLAAAAITLDATGLTLEQDGTTTRFAWSDLAAVTSDVDHVLPRQKLGRNTVSALVLRHRDISTGPPPAPDHRTRVAFLRTIRKPRHQFGAFDFRGLTVVPLAFLGQARAETLCAKAVSMHRTATSA